MLISKKAKNPGAMETVSKFSASLKQNEIEETEQVKASRKRTGNQSKSQVRGKQEASHEVWPLGAIPIWPWECL